jgi:8-oxo-dGTP pyrophosphatase MutT (NUDIX family)
MVQAAVTRTRAPREIRERTAMPSTTGSAQTEDAVILRERRNNARRDVAIVGLRNERGDVLMIETRRLPGSWQPVGGGVDPEDTTPEQAAVREVKEELDLELAVDDLTFVMDAPYEFGEGTVHCFEATLSPAACLQFNKEILRHQWLPVSEARKLPAFKATVQFLQAIG